MMDAFNSHAGELAGPVFLSKGMLACLRKSLCYSPESKKTASEAFDGLLLATVVILQMPWSGGLVIGV